jgi:hypothetical protein
MITTAPAPTPPVEHTTTYEGAPSEHPLVRGALRALNLAAGTLVALTAFVVVGLYAALESCAGGETHGLCAGHPGLVPVLEWPIFVVAVLAPFAGGIAAFVQRRPRWLALGAGIAVVMFGLIALVSTGQTPYDWG